MHEKMRALCTRVDLAQIVIAEEPLDTVAGFEAFIQSGT